MWRPRPHPNVFDWDVRAVDEATRDILWGHVPSMASGIDTCASPDVERVGAACKIMGQLVRTAGAHALCEVPGHVPWAGTAHNRHPRAECLPTAAIIAPHPPRRARPCAPLPLPGSPRCAVTLSSPQRTPKATRCVSGWTTRRWCRHSCALSLHFRRSRGLSRMPCGPCCTSPSQVRHARHAVCSEGGHSVCAHDSVWALWLHGLLLQSTRGL